MSLGSKLDEHRGFGPGFDFLRITLSLSVVTWHSFALSKNAVFVDGTQGVWFAGYTILHLFFALSGFLIAASALRLSLPNFLVNRGLRIFPALIVEILLSAFVLGALFTALPLNEYFATFGTYRYLTNLVGLVNFKLPGVFGENPVHDVNYSLWTVPYEFLCYAIMSGLVIFGLLKRPWLIVAGAFSFAIIGTVLVAYGVHPLQTDSGLFNKVCYFFFTDRGSKLFVAFMLGIAVYLLRYRIPYSHWTAAGCLTFCLGVALVGPQPWLTTPVVNIVASLPLVYLMAYLGASDIPMPAFLHHGDYSYGIYLYGMPIQQVMVNLFPSVHSPLGQLALSVPAIGLFAAFSWHFIEKPILQQRRRFSFVATVRGADDDPAKADLAVQQASSPS